VNSAGSTTPPAVGSASKRANSRPISSNTLRLPRATASLARANAEDGLSASQIASLIGSGPSLALSSAIDATAALPMLVASGD
jgi:hypothetical protein